MSNSNSADIAAFKDVWVFCEQREGKLMPTDFELISKGRDLADELGVNLCGLLLGGEGIESAAKELGGYGADKVIVCESPLLATYTTDGYAKVICDVIEDLKPEAFLIGATNIGRDLGPRVSSALHSGLTADCTSLEIGDYEDKKNNKIYHNLLYQIRPAFGGNIVATIVNPDCRPQMATVREGVMKKEIFNANHQGEIKMIDVNQFTTPEDFVIHVIERHMEKSKVNLKAAPIIVAGGYGVGSKENFQLLHELATVLGGEVGASRAAVDAGFCQHERQIGQTGTTVRPKLYIACGISGQIQHTAGMEESAMVIAINTDSNAPINKFADYVITGDLNVVIPKMIQYYKKNSK